MATKTKKTNTQKSNAKVKDLSTRKDPKGGAQKKETMGSDNRMSRGLNKSSGRLPT